MSRSCPELLAPAGSWAALEAAVRCGADAVYLGASRFNARQNAANFSEEDLYRAVAYCHGRGVRVHLTLNTLVREEELEAALAVAQNACSAGVDALIVQDRGLARRIRAAAPLMPLHASTQLSCHTPAGVRALHEAGFSRVVLAREMSESEIAACAGLGCELETFVHGALCMCVSGQCYLSAVLGGRSGNRGLCAQPCRLPFAPAEAGRPARETEAALSLRDLSLTAEIPRLAACGVCSLKIEGRMKRPEYVAAAVSVCRRALDGLPPDPQLAEDLQRVFSRSGFTDGYFTGRRTQMFGVRRKEDVQAAQAAGPRLRELYRRELSRVPVTAQLTVQPGAPVSLTVSDGERCATATGAMPQPVRQRPLTKEDVTRTVGKTGGTPFVLTDCKALLTPDCTVPGAEIGRLRREALAELLALRERPRPVPFTAALPVPVTPVTEPVPSVIARVAAAAQIPPDGAGAALWIVPLDTDPNEVAVPYGVEIPRGLFGAEEAVRQQLRRHKEAGAQMALCGNVGAIPLAAEAGLAPLGGFGLNITNREALAAYAAAGLKAATASFELTFRQIRPLCGGVLPVGLFVYGRQPLMLMRNCPHRAAAGCAGCDGRGHTGLIDRKGQVFPTACAGGCTELLNSVALDGTDVKEEWPPAAFTLYHFTDESPRQVAAVLARCAAGLPADGPVTRGLYRRGVQ